MFLKISLAVLMIGIIYRFCQLFKYWDEAQGYIILWRTLEFFCFIFVIYFLTK